MSPSRIDELRRRVQNDPASIAFAQLAEEYRRSGQTDEAVRVCREGLTRHPGYLYARVTLGRALLDLAQIPDARAEFEFVVTEAPENLAALRGLAEICQRDGRLADALTYYKRALALARHDPEIEELVQQLSRQVGAESSGDASGLTFEEAHRELLSAAERVPVAR
ncbi:MAG: tetratricopeptide repeat protein, partial [Vicinamibacterales bacterium]